MLTSSSWAACASRDNAFALSFVVDSPVDDRPVVVVVVVGDVIGGDVGVKQARGEQRGP